MMAAAEMRLRQRVVRLSGLLKMLQNGTVAHAAGGQAAVAQGDQLLLQLKNFFKR